MKDNDLGMIKGLFIGMSIGFVAGAVTALFLTTKTGEELRSDIKKLALEIGNKVEEKASKIKNVSKEKYSEIIESVLANYNKVKDFTEKEIDLIRKVISEQKEAPSK
ncbi:MAG: YtxH domain-containing protein [Actinobacteria bacterium]|nr:YtxH domain-containing protein [Actinomycetota bacterium]